MTTTSAEAATTPYEELAAALRGDLITLAIPATAKRAPSTTP